MATNNLSKGEYERLYDLLYRLRNEVGKKTSPAYEPNKDRRKLLRQEIDSVKQDVLGIYQLLEENRTKP